MSTGQATVIVVNNPFDPSEGRVVEVVDAGFTISEWIERNPSVLNYSVVCSVNDIGVLQAQWPVRVIADGDFLSFVLIPQGGGGGGGKNPLLTIIGFALIASGIGIVGLSAFAKYSLIGGGVALIATGLISTPETPTVDQIPKASPTYSLDAQGNLARLGQAIPVGYGLHIAYPDFAIPPHAEFVNNNQFLYQLFVVGQGEYEISDISIEDTPIDRFVGVTWEIIPHDRVVVEGQSPVTLFDPNVVTSLEAAGAEVTRHIDDVSAYVETELDIPIYGPGRNTIGVAATPPGVLVDRYAVDVTFPNGLYYTTRVIEGSTSDRSGFHDATRNLDTSDANTSLSDSDRALIDAISRESDAYNTAQDAVDAFGDATADAQAVADSPTSTNQDRTNAQNAFRSARNAAAAAISDAAAASAAADAALAANNSTFADAVRSQMADDTAAEAADDAAEEAMEDDAQGTPGSGRHNDANPNSPGHPGNQFGGGGGGGGGAPSGGGNSPAGGPGGQSGPSVPQDSDGVPQDNDGVPQDNDGVPQDNEGATGEEHGQTHYVTQYNIYDARFYMQTRRINDEGEPLSAWKSQGLTQITSRQHRSFTRSLLFVLDRKARYEVRIGRDSAQASRSNAVAEAVWSAVRGYSVNTDGSFVLNPAKTVADKIGIDIVFPQGLYSAGSGTSLADTSVNFEVHARQIGNDSKPIGEFFEIGNETVTAKDRTPIRRSFIYDLAVPGRYEVVVARVTLNSTSTTVVDTMQWTGAKAYLVEKEQYEGLTLLAMRMQATNSLTAQSSRKVNLKAARKLPTWTPEAGWSGNVVTRSIAWAIADILRNKVYGASWLDAHLDIKGLYDLDLVWAARGDYFDYRFDRQLNIREALKLVCRAGRATPVLPGGVFRVIRDHQQSIATAMYSDRNIVKGSLNINWITPSEDTADGVRVNYIDPQSWKPNDVTVGYGDLIPVKPATVTIAGITNLAQATREAYYLLNVNALRVTTITFATELEGLISSKGDLISLSHGILTKSITGDVIGTTPVVSTGGVDICLSEPAMIPDVGDDDYFISFRTKAGGESGPHLCAIYDNDGVQCAFIGQQWVETIDPSGDFSTLVHEETDEAIRLYYGDGEERTQFTFGTIETQRRLGVVQDIKPRGDKVEITMLEEDDGVHVT